MAKGSPQLEWCVVRLGEDHNWWVDEVSDPVHWDVDGLSIIDPRQVDHIIELIEPRRRAAEYRIVGHAKMPAVTEQTVPRIGGAS